MAIRKIREISVEVLHIPQDDTYYLKIENYTTYTKQKGMYALGLGLIRIEKDKADELIKELELVAVEREDKSAINWRGKLWHKMMKYRNKNNK
jgi:hypothetical protein